MLDGHALFSDLERNGKVLVKAGTKVVPGIFQKVPVSVLVNVTVEDAVLTERVRLFLSRPRSR